MLPWELICVLGVNMSESGIIILYTASGQGYLVLALYKHALLYYKTSNYSDGLMLDFKCLKMWIVLI